MKRRTGMRLAGAALVLAAFAGRVPAAGELTEAFMPKGGRTLLVELLGADAGAAAVRQILTARLDEAGWAARVAALAAERGARLSAREQATLAAYLGVYMPLPEGRLAAAASGLAAALPRDGRELAWWHCQGCHSLFTSHLTQSRDVQGWRNMFLSPFHRELKLSPPEREEFARYSAINMPMKVDDVPPDLRY